MPRELLIVRLTRPEADLIKQTISNQVDYYFSPSTGCAACRETKSRSGCFQHSSGVTLLRTIKRRFEFPYDNGPVLVEE